MNPRETKEFLDFGKSLIDISRGEVRKVLDNCGRGQSPAPTKIRSRRGGALPPPVDASSTPLAITTKADNSIVTELDIAIEEKLREAILKTFPDHGVLGEEFGATNPESDFQWILDPVDGTEEFANGMPTWGTIVSLHYKGEPIVGIIDHPELGITLSASKGNGAFKNDLPISLDRSDSGRLKRRPYSRDVISNKTVISITTLENFLRFNGSAQNYHNIISHFPNFRVFRSCYGHTTAITGSTNAMCEYNVRIWDIAATEILIKEAGGAYEVIKAIEEDVGMVYGVVFGQKEVVDHIIKLM